METQIHAKLLLKTPRIENGVMKITFYDPLKQNEQEEVIPISEEFITFLRRKEVDDGLIRNEANDTWFIPAKTSIGRGTHITRGTLYLQWLSAQITQQKREIGGSYQGMQMLANDSYDLSINKNDSSLPQELISAANQQLQHDGKNCVPLTFFSAAKRYAGKNIRDQTPHMQNLVDKFREDFNIDLHTKEELVAA